MHVLCERGTNIFCVNATRFHRPESVFNQLTFDGKCPAPVYKVHGVGFVTVCEGIKPCALYHILRACMCGTSKFLQPIKPHFVRKDVGTLVSGVKIQHYYRYAVKKEQDVVAALEYLLASTKPSIILPVLSRVCIF